MLHRSLALPTRLAGALVAASFTVACASAPEYAGDESARTVIVIDNSSNTISDATVYLVPENGARQRLGNLNLGDTQRFEIQAPPGFDHHLLLDVPGSDDLRSRTFTLSAGDTLEWNLNLNRLNFVSGG